MAPVVRLEGVEPAEAAWQKLRQDSPNRHFILYYWIEGALPLMLYGCRGGGLLGRDLAFVCDETLSGGIAADVLRRLGWEHMLLRHRRPGTLARDVGKLVRATGSIGIAVDGRGPYREVGSSFARLARQSEAIAVPLGIRVRGSLSLPLPGPVAIPRKGTQVDLALGQPVDCSLEVADLLERLQSALDSASSAQRPRGDAARVVAAGD
ncbi:MAG: hypothetical protein P8R42_22490 [Candidatus Binatia bacterium]|nr:hypothetical protein [Candidatus Binatia bacterium]